MIIPKNETRKFKLGKMSNNIKYVLINNKSLDKTQVCVNVNIGSAMDPKRNMGLAHFLEHMLFMGNKKYPDEDFFDSHVKKYGGYSNAYTATFETVYFFQCNNEGIEIACDCFSEFFKSPLFDKSSVGREINAINSEHSKNLESYIFRLRHFMNSKSKKDSILNKFYTGNLKSFNKDVRKDMLELYNKYYVSENITICIHSNLSFKEQKKLLKSFESIENKKSTPFPFSIEKPLFNKTNEIYHLESTDDSYKMLVYYEIDYPKNTFKTLSHMIVRELFNSNSTSSLKQTLIRKRLVSEIYGYELDEGIMLIYFEMFDKENKTISKIIKYLEQYIMFLLKSSKLEKYIENFKEIAQIMFDNGENVNAIDITNDLSSNLHHFPEKYFYSADKLIFAPTSEIILDIKKNLELFVNHKIVIYHKKNLGKMKSFDKYYMMKHQAYDYNNIVDSTISIKDIKFDLDIMNIKEPKLNKVKNMYQPIKKNNIYYITNHQFKEPVVYLKLFHKLDKSLLNSIEDFCNIKMFIEYMNSIIEIKLEKFNKIGSSIYLTLDLFSGAIVINLSCFNNVTFKILSELDKIIKEDKDDMIIFYKVKKNLIDSYLSKTTDTPWNLMGYLVHNSFYNNMFSLNNILDGIKEVKKIHNLDLDLLEKTVYIVGNFKMLDLDILEKKYKNKVVVERFKEDIVIKDFNHIISKNINQTCYSHNYNIGTYEDNKNCILALITNIFGSKFFNEFRTVKQYGYMVSFNSNKINAKDNNIYLLSLKVQTEKNSNKLDNEMKQFIKEMKPYLEKLEIEPYVNNLIIRLKEDYKNTSELLEDYYGEILNQTFNFNKKKNIIECLLKIQKEDICKFIDKYLLENKPVIFKVTK